MKILVFEYVTGGGLLAEPLPVSLAREGELMLGALLRDLSEIPGVATVVFRDARLPVPEVDSTGSKWIVLDRPSDWERAFDEQIRHSDAVWPIAPESGGILEKVCRKVEAAGKVLLTSSAAAVRIAASKWETIRRLTSRGVPVVPTIPVTRALPPRFPLVVKPDDGVGCEGARIVANPEEWRACWANLPTGYVVQPLIEGEALSLSAVFAHGEARLLSCNRQNITREDGGFLFKGCTVNALSRESAAFLDLSERIAVALPELWGYAGVDLIRSERGLHVLEINPRLTTSYAGLRLSTGINLAGLVLELWRHGGLPDIPAESLEPVEIYLEPHDAD